MLRGAASSLLLVLLLSACPSDGEPDCDPTPDQTNACCCFSGSQDPVYIVNSCPVVEQCPSVVITCSWDDPECPAPRADGSAMGGAEPFEVNDEAALECVLQALRDGTPGTLSWSFQGSTYGGQYRRDVDQHVAANRVVLAQAEDVLDQSGRLDDVTQETLMPPEHFDECLAATDVRTRALCLVETTTGTVTNTCAMGGSYSNF